MKELKSKIRVLVVDDSLVFREMISRKISSDPEIQVVAKAVDPYDARDKILEFEPDVMTCDIQMPKLSGIDFIRQLMPQYPLPVIVVSTVSDAVFDALDVGAVDFVQKPNVDSKEGIDLFADNLISKIKVAARAKIRPSKVTIKSRTNVSKKEVVTSNEFRDKVIAIGASTGGTEAISKLLKETSTNIPGIVIVQHIPPVFSKMFADRLNQSTGFTVKEAETGDLIEPGKVLVAPGDRHMRVKKVGSKYSVVCFTADKVSGHRPSVDVLFDSVAEVYKDKGIGIILTGMGHDGAKGLLSMKNHGAITIGQTQESCVVYGMPRVAYNLGAVQKQLSLENIPQFINNLF